MGRFPSVWSQPPIVLTERLNCILSMNTVMVLGQVYGRGTSERLPAVGSQLEMVTNISGQAVLGILRRTHTHSKLGLNSVRLFYHCEYKRSANTHRDARHGARCVSIKQISPWHKPRRSMSDIWSFSPNICCCDLLPIFTWHTWVCISWGSSMQ